MCSIVLIPMAIFWFVAQDPSPEAPRVKQPVVSCEHSFTSNLFADDQAVSLRLLQNVSVRRSTKISNCELLVRAGGRLGCVHIRIS
jgi:hypothetical protein